MNMIELIKKALQFGQTPSVYPTCWSCFGTISYSIHGKSKGTYPAVHSNRNVMCGRKTRRVDGVIVSSHDRQVGNQLRLQLALICFPHMFAFRFLAEYIYNTYIIHIYNTYIIHITYILHTYCIHNIYIYTSSTAQGGGGSFIGNL